MLAATCTQRNASLIRTQHGASGTAFLFSPLSALQRLSAYCYRWEAEDGADRGITWGFLCLSVHCHSIMGSCRIHLSTLSLTSLVLNQRRQHKSSLVDFLLVSVQHNSMVETRRQTAAYTHNGERTVGDKSLSESFLSGRQAVSRPRKHIWFIRSTPNRVQQRSAS